MASIIKKIKEYNEGSQPELLELKWKAMRESPFAFYRGTCHLFAEDFVKSFNYEKPKTKTWICGDAHFENFGSYKGSNRQVYFDLNDFDEALLASPEPELARFLTSIIVIAFQMNIASVKLHKLLYDIMGMYVGTLQTGKALMMEAEVAHGAFRKYFEQISTRDRQSYIDKLTHKEKGALLLKHDSKYLLPLDENRKIKIYASIMPLFNNHPHFSQFVFEDAAIRVAGVGSLGLERYCVLCFSKKKGKRYLLDLKQARASCFAKQVDVKQPRTSNEADRIISAGYLLQFNSPAFESAMNMDNKWFIVKELQPSNDKMDVNNFTNDLSALSEVAEEMAVLLAYAHIRSSGHRGASTADELMRFADKKQWQKDVIDISGILAKKNEKYYKTFIKEEKI